MTGTIKLGLPKGSLQEATLALFRRAGFDFSIEGRSYHVTSDDPEITAILIRAQEMAHYVEKGFFDAGLTGLDWIRETRADVVEVAELVYSKASMRPVRWVLAVPEASSIYSVKDLEGKRIATEAVELTRDWLARHGVKAEVEFSWGATEIKAPEFVDAIVEVTETGSSLRANHLRIVETILESSTRLIANRQAWADPAKREKIESIALLLQAAIAAEGKVGLKMNVPKAVLEAVTRILPALTSPTISHLADPDWVAVEIIAAESAVKKMIPELRRAGARGIIEYPLNKVID
ncbi:MAG: ATP phosphoribosyltransferase [bacterium]|nr:ATP phosphoribosyltransferase [bacterium]